ncbi:MAG: hypothetical protein N2037_10195 [Acidimicrobiales bacterium]|nr:hypothetical protein [Acidimicrobiales bacterium]
MDEDIITEVLGDSKPGRMRCSIPEILESLPDYARDAYEHLITSKSATSTAITRSLNTRFNANLSPKTLQRHRRGECTCGRS